eukprot:TRINITY_DN5491_c0_g1_i6.p1 TRINITY_DN5491_c0_g1~~TRINITY_DN5491_c0_g1_i6.p1  ORF type:complete len:289 (+),score=24.31 TRINITY_DN5491_c0_g1_i6:66-869(+)
MAMYRLYSAPNCPFAHRVRIMRQLRGLEASILLTSAHGQSKEGFFFAEPEPEFGESSLPAVYRGADPEYQGKFVVPLLLDRESKTIASNDSLPACQLLLRMPTTVEGAGLAELVPEGAEAFASEISNMLVTAPYRFLNATSGDEKDQAREAMFAQLERFDAMLATSPFAMGDQLTLPDIVLWPALIRYDNVYARQFGLTGKSIQFDFLNLHRYIQRVASYPTPSGSTLGADANLPDIVRLYWQSENLSPKAGNDPTAPVPEVIDLGF